MEIFTFFSFNAPNWLNDGMLCQCSGKEKEFGIRHGIYPGEKPAPEVEPLENNIGEL